MTSQQFEQYTNALLNKYGYESINPTKRVLGRGTTHQIDAIGISKAIPTFSYPITVIVEAKYRSTKKPIGIDIIRNFYGVIQDIQQQLPNYFSPPRLNNQQYINGTSNIVGIVISTTSFSSYARAFAYSHGIYMLTLGHILKNNSHYFGNIDGQPIIIQVPNKVKLDLDKIDERNFTITKILDDEKMYVEEKKTLTGELILKKKIEYNDENYKSKSTQSDNVNCYLYDIKIKDLKAAFRTITLNEINEDTDLIVELPKSRQYLKIEIKRKKITNSLLI